KGTHGGKDIDETTERLLPPNLQCLKVVLQANNQLSRLEKEVGTGVAPVQDRADNDESSDPQQAADQKRKDVEAWLTRHREEAARAGRVPRYLNTEILIQDLVSSLLGEPNQGCG